MKRIITLNSLCIILVVLSFAMDGYTAEKPSRPHSAIARNLQWVGIAVEEPDYTIWGASPIRDDEGRVHLFVARWPDKNVDPAWRKSCEIAHYVSDTPEGPFIFSDVALKGTGRATWDRYAPHNPEIRRVDEKYALFYIGNGDFRQPPHPLNQKIGLALSDSPYGPWKKVGEEGLILDHSKDPNHWTHGRQVVNPSFLKHKDKYLLYFKSTHSRWKTTAYGVATADRLEGPYTLPEAPLSYQGIVIEDGYVFPWDDKICLLTTDNHGKVTGVVGGGALWVSDDGVRFDPELIQLGYERIPAYYKAYDPKNIKRVYGGAPKMERPKLLIDDGKPTYLYAPSGWNVTGGPRTVCHVLKIDLGPRDGPVPPGKRNP